MTYADVIQAASPSYADVVAAISEAKAGYVLVPAGEATWSQRLEITKPISLIGADIGNTVITSAYHPTDPHRYKQVKENYLITYYPSQPVNDYRNTFQDKRLHAQRWGKLLLGSYFIIRRSIRRNTFGSTM